MENSRSLRASKPGNPLGLNIIISSLNLGRGKHYRHTRQWMAYSTNVLMFIAIDAIALKNRKGPRIYYSYRIRYWSRYIQWLAEVLISLSIVTLILLTSCDLHTYNTAKSVKSLLICVWLRNAWLRRDSINLLLLSNCTLFRTLQGSC